jgi:phenylpropionate dioxygenase-like ring-hydroxylating dioxygenase large terminal subunit
MLGTGPAWAKAVANAPSFEHEQAELGRFWTLLGITTDLRHDGDWIRATLGGRSVFVQRFDDEIRGFENLCVHRFYPLRTSDSGHGPIRCGFHHWQYNKDGLAVGIPKCREMFGKTPRQLGARLRSIEIATCGILIFGRFANAERTESLAEYLDAGFPILEAMWSLRRRPRTIRTEIAANWKLCFHITLDDYHIVAVHPDTFGKNGYLPRDAVKYFQFGEHSAYFYGASDDALAKMSAACTDGSYRPDSYRILQIFPNLLALHFEAAGTWHVMIQQYVPIAHDRSMSRSWYSPAPFPAADRNWWQTLRRLSAAPFLPLAVRIVSRKIYGEDNLICEQIQTAAHQIDAAPMLGRHETRIAWFEEVYAKAVMAPRDPYSRAGGNEPGPSRQDIAAAPATPEISNVSESGACTQRVGSATPFSEEKPRAASFDRWQGG